MSFKKSTTIVVVIFALIVSGVVFWLRRSHSVSDDASGKQEFANNIRDSKVDIKTVEQEKIIFNKNLQELESKETAQSKALQEEKKRAFIDQIKSQ